MTDRFKKCGHLKTREHIYTRPDKRGIECGTCRKARSRAYAESRRQELERLRELVATLGG